MWIASCDTITATSCAVYMIQQCTQPETSCLSHMHRDWAHQALRCRHAASLPVWCYRSPTLGDASLAQEHLGHLEFEMDAADTLECLLTELQYTGAGRQLCKVLPSITKADVAVAQRLHEAGILLVK